MPKCGDGVQGGRPQSVPSSETSSQQQGCVAIGHKGRLKEEALAERAGYLNSELQESKG